MAKTIYTGHFIEFKAVESSIGVSAVTEVYSREDKANANPSVLLGVIKPIAPLKFEPANREGIHAALLAEIVEGIKATTPRSDTIA
jgi:hypothetical protein